MSNSSAGNSAARCAEITAEIKKQDAAALVGVLEIGKLLTEAKSLLPHGEFIPWVVSEFGWSASYAARLMRLYNEFPTGAPAGMGISTLLLTLTLEEGIRSSLNEIISKAELSKAEAERLVKKCKDDQAAIDKMRESLNSPEAREAIKAELRTEIKAESEASVKSAKEAAKSEASVALAELENINSQLQNRLRDSETALHAANVEAGKSAEYKTKMEALNTQLLEARVSISNAKREAEAASARAIAAESSAKSSKKEVKVEVPVEVPPADYEYLKAAVARLEADLSAVRSASVVQAAEAFVASEEPKDLQEVIDNVFHLIQDSKTSGRSPRLIDKIEEMVRPFVTCEAVA
jgi:hypothetical protein